MKLVSAALTAIVVLAVIFASSMVIIAASTIFAKKSRLPKTLFLCLNSEV